MYHLNVEQRDAILERIPLPQREFLMLNMVRGQRTAFAREIAKQKGAIVPENASYEEIEHLVDGWIYVGYHDAGHVSKDYPCECGRALRYQHTVQNKQTGDVLKFGIDHLQLHTGIDAKTVAQIKKGFDSIDIELSEILMKIDSGWSLEHVMEQIPTGLEIPKDIKEHLDLGLPLLDRQLNRLRNLIRSFGIDQRSMNLRIKSQPVDPEIAKPVQASFFISDIEAAAAQNVVYSSNSIKSNDSPNYGLTFAQEQAIEKYLKEGISSARIICELLIKHHRASDSRFITEKPKIYVKVCYYIESLGYQIKSKDPDDRNYELNHSL